MEKLDFKVPSSDDKLIIQVVDNYNKHYGTDFAIAEFIYDEVVFVRLTATEYSLEDVFNLGYQFGVTAQYKREKGEISW
jgi:hypothetical protein